MQIETTIIVIGTYKRNDILMYRFHQIDPSEAHVAHTLMCVNICMIIYTYVTCHHMYPSEAHVAHTLYVREYMHDYIHICNMSPYVSQ